MRHLRSLMTLVFIGAIVVMMSGTSAADVMIYASTTAPTLGPDRGLVTVSNDVVFNGTSEIRAEDGSINSVVISLQGLKFTAATFAICGVDETHSLLNVSVYLSDGGVMQSFYLPAGADSRDWITVQAWGAGETISRIVISNAKFGALEDTHIIGAQSSVPEPATLTLVCSGLLGIGNKLRKYNRTANGA